MAGVQPVIVGEQGAVVSPDPADYSMDDSAAADQGLGLRQRKTNGDGGDATADKTPEEEPVELDAAQKLLIDDKILAMSLNALFFGVFIDAVCSSILGPNYPFMVNRAVDPATGAETDEPAHKEGFDDLGGLGVTTANYVIPMCASLASSLSGLVFGPLSDKIGRKPIILLCLYVGAGGCVLKYALRGSFWGFCGANFANGLFGCSITIGCAYVGDLFEHDPAKKEEVMGTVYGVWMLGGGLGGICAILMESSGLFMPLWLGAGLSLFAGFYVHLRMVEPNKELQKKVTKKKHDDAADGGGDDDEEATDKDAKPADDGAVTELNKPVLINILAGAVADNIGSTGMSLALMPVLFSKYVIGPTFRGDDSTMSPEGYKWLSCCFIFDLIPGMIACMILTQKIGLGASVVLGNFITAFFTAALLIVGVYVTDDGSGMLAVFLVIFLGGYPCTILSQLTTAPMLDKISPPEMRGTIQGYNTLCSDLTGALVPVILGEVQKAAGSYGQEFIMWVTVVWSLLACIINAPLMFNPLYGPQPDEDLNLKGLLGDDVDLIKRAEAGEWVPLADLERINLERMKKGEPFLRMHYGKYADDAPKLWKMRQQAAADFRWIKADMTKWLAKMRDPAVRDEMVKGINESRATPEQQAESRRELGEWFTDYLAANGWWADDNPMVMKELIMSAFPHVSDPEITADTIESTIVKSLRVMNRNIDLAEDQDPFTSLLSKRANPRH
mmetsp:Transcript_46454/g.129429  ORF Transcript_46454/g.129429 Transcript_46454/m.129429 type:complete len:728 (+) Transcript_46454:189-2372(+)